MLMKLFDYRPAADDGGLHVDVHVHAGVHVHVDVHEHVGVHEHVDVRVHAGVDAGADAAVVQWTSLEEGLEVCFGFFLFFFDKRSRNLSLISG